MNDLHPYYNLYCINLHCDISIYNKIMGLEVPFTEQNLLDTHSCICCEQPMVSAMEIEIEQVVAGAGIRLSDDNFLNAG
jgi:hypothetical protein